MDFSQDTTFDPKTLADDLCEVQDIYATFFAGLKDTDWEKPVKGAPKEWNLRETVAHLCALNGAGLESIRAALQGEPYTFPGLEHRHQFHAFNRRGIDERVALPTEELSREVLDILNRAARIARELRPNQTEITSNMPIYNRPVKVIEALSIIMFHTGLHHAAQVAEPAGVPSLWVHLSPEVRHRVIGRVMRALSLLYRKDLGGDLRAVIAFRVKGPGGGEWHVDLAPDSSDSSEGPVNRPNLIIQLRETDDFCKMFTGRLNIPLALLTGQMRLRGNLRLFTRFGSLFSVDAKH